MIDQLIDRRCDDDRVVRNITRQEWQKVVSEVIERERELVGRYQGSFERDRLFADRAPAEVLRLLTKGRERPDIVCSRAYGMGMDVNDFPPSSFTAIATTTSETGLWTPNIWTPAPANDARAGKVYKVNFGGILGTSSAAPTAAWTPRWTQSTATPPTGTSLGATTAVTMTASLGSVPIYGEFTAGWRIIGLAASGGTLTGNGFVCIGDLTTTAGKILVMGGTVAGSADQTTAQGLLISLTWGTSAAANTCTCQWAMIRTAN